MRRFFAGVAATALVGCSVHHEVDKGHVQQQECATTRDVQLVVFRLREEGWSAARTVTTVLAVAEVSDDETKIWFAGLVKRVYASTAVLSDIEAEYARCMQMGEQPETTVVLAETR